MRITPARISNTLIFLCNFSNTVKNNANDKAEAIKGIPKPNEKKRSKRKPLKRVAFRPAVIRIAVKIGVAQAVQLNANAAPIKNVPKNPAGLRRGIKLLLLRNIFIFPWKRRYPPKNITITPPIISRGNLNLKT